MAERFGARLKYEDELAAKMRQCEEQLELMYIKREQRKQQRVRNEEQRRKEEEERRARKAAKKEEERRVKRHETELKKIEEAIQRRKTEYLEIKRLDTIKLQRMKEEMDKVGAELQKVMAKRDRARKIRQMIRKEETEKEQDEMKEKIQRQPDVKDETLMDQNIGFHRTSDELCQFQTPILIPHADEVLVNVHEFSKLESLCDVTRTEAMPPLVDASTSPNVLILPVLPEHPIVTAGVDLDDGQDEHSKPVPSNVQPSPHLNKDHLCHEHEESEHEHEESELCSTIDVLDAGINSNDTTMTQADVSQTNAAPVEAAAHPAILYIPDLQDATVCLLDVSQNMNRSTIEQVVQPVVPYLPEPHDQFDHTVQMFRLYCFSCTSVNKIFYCVSLCLLYVLYCSIVLRYCTYLNPCSV